MSDAKPIRFMSLPPLFRVLEAVGMSSHGQRYVTPPEVEECARIMRTPGHVNDWPQEIFDRHEACVARLREWCDKPETRTITPGYVEPPDIVLHRILPSKERP
jgi:hypothetical protein